MGAAWEGSLLFPMFGCGCLIAGSVTQSAESDARGRAGHNVKAEPVAVEATAAPSANHDRGGTGGGGGGGRGRVCGRICLVLAMAGGLSLAAVGLIATPIDQDLNTSAAGAQSLAPTLQTQAVAFAGTPAVGALFAVTSGGGLGGHFCSASVVDSPGPDPGITDG